MKFLFVLLSVLIFSCSNHKDESSASETSPLDLNGIYQTKKLENDQGDAYRYFLKFYEDGTVIRVTSSVTAEDIKGWFKRGHENVGEGEYEMTGDDISFTTTGKNGEMQYEGKIKDKATLSLRSKSAENDEEEVVTYKLVED